MWLGLPIMGTPRPPSLESFHGTQSEGAPSHQTALENGGTLSLTVAPNTLGLTKKGTCIRATCLRETRVSGF